MSIKNQKLPYYLPTETKVASKNNPSVLLGTIIGTVTVDNVKKPFIRLVNNTDKAYEYKNIVKFGNSPPSSASLVSASSQVQPSAPKQTWTNWAFSKIPAKKIISEDNKKKINQEFNNKKKELAKFISKSNSGKYFNFENNIIYYEGDKFYLVINNEFMCDISDIPFIIPILEYLNGDLNNNNKNRTSYKNIQNYIEKYINKFSKNNTFKKKLEELNITKNKLKIKDTQYNVKSIIYEEDDNKINFYFKLDNDRDIYIKNTNPTFSIGDIINNKQRFQPKSTVYDKNGIKYSVLSYNPTKKTYKLTNGNGNESINGHIFIVDETQLTNQIPTKKIVLDNSNYEKARKFALSGVKSVVGTLSSSLLPKGEKTSESFKRVVIPKNEMNENNGKIYFINEVDGSNYILSKVKFTGDRKELKKNNVLLKLSQNNSIKNKKGKRISKKNVDFAENFIVDNEVFLLNNLTKPRKIIQANRNKDYVTLNGKNVIKKKEIIKLTKTKKEIQKKNEPKTVHYAPQQRQVRVTKRL